MKRLLWIDAKILQFFTTISIHFNWLTGVPLRSTRGYNLSPAIAGCTSASQLSFTLCAISAS